MLQALESCQSCDGAGRTSARSSAWAVVRDGVADLATVTGEIDHSKSHTLHGCHSCNGMTGPDGRTYAKYRHSVGKHGDPFKSAAALKAALTRGTAKVCKLCEGHGKIANVRVFADCYSCSGRGTRLTWNASADPILPPEIGPCENATRAFMLAWLGSVTVRVVRLDRGATWGESYVGAPGAIDGTLTDYGRSWKTSDEDLISEVLLRLVPEHDHGPQFINMIDRETRRFGKTLAIIVTRGGRHTRVIDAVPTPLPLPPTYTPEVLNREIR